mmetsp:Transcript_10039/g.15481  ORF Transcript_10039/g.15481 Transcript_10039/m.15481 type:complete len:479 (-) Transcript_10039:62-1498(-)
MPRTTNTTLKPPPPKQRKRDILMFAFGCVCTLTVMGTIQNLSRSTQTMTYYMTDGIHHPHPNKDNIILMENQTDQTDLTPPIHNKNSSPPPTTNRPPVKKSWMNATMTNVVQQLEQQTNTNTAAVAKLAGGGTTPQWTRYEGVVIATKVHGPQNAGEARQMICLLTVAYNQHVNYDILIFSTLPWNDHDVAKVQEYAGDNVNVTVVADPFTLEEHLANMTTLEKDMLYKRCKVQPHENLTWSHKCCEDGYPHCTGLGYAWQSEFRSYQIWTQQALQPYKYMFWIDSDALMTQSWTPDMDPMKLIVEHDLVLLFDNFPKGNGKGPALTDKIKQVYNTSLCSLRLSPQGQFDSTLNPECGAHFGLVHGMFHITNIEFYTSALQMTWAKVLTSPYHFQRQFDDQIAVTVPAAILAPDRAWDMRAQGLNLSVWHNGDRDGKPGEPLRPRGYKMWWNTKGKTLWPEEYAACHRVIHHPGRRCR